MTLENIKTKGLCGLNGSTPAPLIEDHDSGDADSITHARREYLAEIYRLQTSTDESITTTALAMRLDVTPPAVVRMMRRLAHEGYLKRQPYKGVRLTPEGEREALKSIRRHRLLEAFLVTVMKFGWDEVHTHAHALEAALNDQFESVITHRRSYATSPSFNFFQARPFRSSVARRSKVPCELKTGRASMCWGQNWLNKFLLRRKMADSL
ncbi:MAG: metal-dependent transcriptional regulator [Chloroflexi bacterium]|nr:metal-dependent transcriptional regulator [Chloroflexota bacterium]